MLNDKRILELESELNDKKTRLESYEKVEQEMDSVIRQVAESSNLIKYSCSKKFFFNCLVY